jgi:transposase
MAQNTALTRRVEALEEKLRANSSNSSKPPSSDLPGMQGRKGKSRRKRKRGGQPGHEGATRELVPESEIDQVVACLPEQRCPCGGRVSVTEERAPERQQKFELPRVRPEVTEYQLFSGCCATCGRTHRGQLPSGVSSGILGPRALATVAVYSGEYHLSKRQIEQVLQDQFGLPVALGTISNAEAKVSEALQSPVQEAREYVKQQAVVHADETGHRMAGKRAWVWTAVTSLVAVFLVRASRGSAVAKELLGEGFRNILVSDRWNAYNWLDIAQRQLCWAHLIRDFKKIAERGGASKAIADPILEHVKQMFVLWRRVKDGKRTHRWLQLQMLGIRPEIEGLLEQGTCCGHRKTEGTCKRILKARVALWLFVDLAGVEPTNNLAERMIRPYVLWRKMSCGTQSERGNVFVQRLLTVTATCRLQQRNVFDYLTAAINAHLRGTEIPSLIPDADPRQAAPLAA